MDWSSLLTLIFFAVVAILAALAFREYRPKWERLKKSARAQPDHWQP